jgi:hypothetical protein
LLVSRVVPEKSGEGHDDMHNLARFSLRDMIECSSVIRKLGNDATSMEQAAQRLISFLYDDLVDPHTLARSCALVRFYKTHSFGQLDDIRRHSAESLLPGGFIDPEMRCLTLLATMGNEPAWCSVAQSRGHQVIPLQSEESVARLPMVAQLIAELGVDLGAVLRLAVMRDAASPVGARGATPPLQADTKAQNFNVFYVREAAGCPYVPAQAEFVERHGVRSVLGFGGQLPTGDIFAVILFTKVPVQAETRELFKTIALATKLCVVPFAKDHIFAQPRGGQPQAGNPVPDARTILQ